MEDVGRRADEDSVRYVALKLANRGVVIRAAIPSR